MNYYDFDHTDDPPVSDPEAADLFYTAHEANERIPDEAMTFYLENAHLAVSHPVCHCGQAMQPNTGAGQPQKTCSAACRQKLYRKRRAAGVPMEKRNSIANTGETPQETIPKAGPEELAVYREIKAGESMTGRWDGFKTDSHQLTSPTDEDHQIGRQGYGGGTLEDWNVPYAGEQPKPAYDPRVAFDNKQFRGMYEAGHPVSLIAEDALDLERKYQAREWRDVAGEAATYWLTFYDKHGRAPTEDEVPYTNEKRKHHWSSSETLRQMDMDDSELPMEHGDGEL